MLSKEESRRVEEHLITHYAPTEADMDYLNTLDDYIVACSISPAYARAQEQQLVDTAKDVHRKMSAIFMLDGGCSPRLLEYQERYFQLCVLHCKAIGTDDIDPLAMLCFTSSFDLFWLQVQNQQG